jgi:crotonobetainyl-CoA:carnitine CoA-transferase CaiB-like acyl-CoA transferase
MTDGALSDLTVLEIGETISAPFCAKLMADLGADVIKIEHPMKGDSARQLGPFPDDIPHREKSGLFLYLNFNKIGITLDIGDPEGQGLLHSLLSGADVLVHNLPPERAEELGLFYDRLKETNRGIVVTSITPFGMAGPYRSFKATPYNVCHIGGAAYHLGEPEREPLPWPADQSAYFSAISAAGATLCALFDRDEDGAGQDVDIAEADVIANFLMGQTVTRASVLGFPITRYGHRLPLLFPTTVLPCRDGYVSLVAQEDDQWERLVEVMGSPEWSKEDMFKTSWGRSVNADALEDLMHPWLMDHTKEEIFQTCQANRIPTAPLYTVGELVRHPHLAAREFFVEQGHPVAGSLTYPAAAYVLSESPWAFCRPAPILGEHNHEVYCGRLGLCPEDCARLASRGVI